ncbi:hypothetical protein [Aneurinibacillus aneurinilyticus]|uniref:hypothetical protein n=1 Tax=Aneurinibacillus aneurinilyticus TaxID=1391 RepID=UPI003524D49E
MKTFQEQTDETVTALFDLIQRCCKHGSDEELRVLPELVKATAELVKAHKEI